MHADGYDETIAGVGAPELHLDRVVTRRNIRKNELVGMRGSVEIVDRGICHLGRDSGFGIIEESANPHCTVGSGCEGLRRNRTMTQLLLLPPCVKPTCVSGTVTKLDDSVTLGSRSDTATFSFVGAHVTTVGAAGAAAGGNMASNKAALAFTNECVVFAKSCHAPDPRERKAPVILGLHWAPKQSRSANFPPGMRNSRWVPDRQTTAANNGRHEVITTQQGS